MALAEVPVDRPLGVDTPVGAVVLVRCEDEVAAFADECPHRGYPIRGGTIEGCALVCPWHRFAFDLRDGRSLDGRSEALRPVLVRRVGGEVRIFAAP